MPRITWCVSETLTAICAATKIGTNGARNKEWYTIFQDVLLCLTRVIAPVTAVTRLLLTPWGSIKLK